MSKTRSKTTAVPASTKRAIDSRKYRSRAEREAEMNRLVLIVAGVLAGVIILILAGAFLFEGVIIPNQAVASVNGQNISTRDFQKRVVFDRWRTGSLLASIYNQFGAQYAEQLFTSQQSPYAQLYQQLAYPTTMGRAVLDELTEALLTQQYAKANNITVSD
jgi:hypothetical protein